MKIPSSSTPVPSGVHSANHQIRQTADSAVLAYDGSGAPSSVNEPSSNQTMRDHSQASLVWSGVNDESSVQVGSELPGTGGLRMQSGETVFLQRVLALPRVEHQLDCMMITDRELKLDFLFERLRHICCKPGRKEDIACLAGAPTVQQWVASILDRIENNPDCRWSFQYSKARDTYYIKVYDQLQHRAQASDKEMGDSDVVVEQLVVKPKASLQIWTGYPIRTLNRVLLDRDRYELLAANNLDGLGLGYGTSLIDAFDNAESASISVIGERPTGESISKETLTKEGLSEQPLIAATNRFAHLFDERAVLPDDEQALKQPVGTEQAPSSQPAPASAHSIDRPQHAQVAALQRAIEDFQADVVKAEVLINREQAVLDRCLAEAGVNHFPDLTLEESSRFSAAIKTHDFHKAAFALLDHLKIIEYGLEEIARIKNEVSSVLTRQEQLQFTDAYDQALEEYQELLIAQGEIAFPSSVATYPVLAKVLPLMQTLMPVLTGMIDTMASNDPEAMAQLGEQIAAIPEQLKEFETVAQLFNGTNPPSNKAQTPQESFAELRQMQHQVDYTTQYAKQFERYCGAWIEQNPDLFARYQQTIALVSEFSQLIGNNLTEKRIQQLEASSKASKQQSRMLAMLSTELGQMQTAIERHAARALDNLDLPEIPPAKSFRQTWRPAQANAEMAYAFERAHIATMRDDLLTDESHVKLRNLLHELKEIPLPQLGESADNA